MSILGTLTVLIPFLNLIRNVGSDNKGLFVVTIFLGFLIQSIIFITWLLLSIVSLHKKDKLLKIILIVLAYIPLLYIRYFDNMAYMICYAISLFLCSIIILIDYKSGNWLE
jgi:hypothetical protein